MVKRAIRDLHSERQTPPRFCDVVIEGDNTYLEYKKDKNKYVKIPWEDVVYQVEAAQEDSKQETETNASSPVNRRQKLPQVVQ